jgi:ADP-ribose pyrophosphatase
VKGPSSLLQRVELHLSNLSPKNYSRNVMPVARTSLQVLRHHRKFTAFRAAISTPPYQLRNIHHTTAMPSSAQPPRIDRITPLPSQEAKWIEFLKLDWTDQNGQARVWEAAGRKTRGLSGVDAVTIMTILRHASRPPATILVLQYRPPVDAICVEFPAGLIDAGETPEGAAERELKEETGYVGRVIGMSPTVVSNPGMSTGNMQLATVEVVLGEEDSQPEQKLEEGEFIELVIVPLAELYERLVAYSAEGKKVDSRLWHTAAGLQLAKQLQYPLASS